MNKVLIDTNIFSLAMKGDNYVIQKVNMIVRIGFSAVSAGELYSGFKGGGREMKNRVELGSFLDSPRVVVYPIDVETADFYASILTNLKSAGTPIPTNDIWIAAVAFQQGCKVFTKDKHFNLISGLVLY